jgi:hypothetical protein
MAWLAVCRPPIRVVRLAFLLGLALFLPYFLLLPIMPVARREPLDVRGPDGVTRILGSC